MTNTKSKPSNSRGGRLRAPQERPHIQVPGDELWPIVDIAADFVAYAKNGIARKMLANRLLATNWRGRR
jgi:hypothetical protein